MEPGEALSTAAQIAVALAGFAGVVVAFRSKSLHEWTPRDRFRLWLLLGNALLPLFSCLFGMLLLSIKPTPHFIWNWCSGFSIVLTFPFAFLTQHRLRELGPEVIRNMKAYRYLFYLVGALGTLVALLQFYNALVSGVFWLFYAAVVLQLAIGALQFSLMILLPSQTSEN
jgi:hypothetical protein